MLQGYFNNYLLHEWIPLGFKKKKKPKQELAGCVFSAFFIEKQWNTLRSDLLILEALLGSNIWFSLQQKWIFDFCFFLVIGQERFGNMTRVYYREAMGAFIVFDVTRPATFEAVTKWKNDLDSKLSLPNGKPVSVVLLANKCDQGKDVLLNNGLKMDQFCKEHGFVGWFETSAKVMWR